MLLFFDTETTGLPPKGREYREIDAWPRAVSIGWAVFTSGGRCRSQEYFVVKPRGFRIPAAASSIHGITTQQARREGSPLAEVLEKFREDVLQHRVTTIVAHNLEFDRTVALYEGIRADTALGIESLNGVCTMKSSSAYCRLPGRRGSYKWPTLNELYECAFKRERIGGHHSLKDALDTAKCFFRLSRSGWSFPHEDFSGGGIARELIDRVLDWAVYQPHFDDRFVLSLFRRVRSGGTLSPKQFSALEHIVQQWEVP